MRGPGRPENTVEAVIAARAAGADGCEVDLRLSADGVLVGAHDDDLSRVAGCPLRVSATPAAALLRVALPGGTRPARAEDLVAASSGSRLVLELKRPPEAPGAVRRTVEALDRTLLRLPRRTEVTVSSFDPRLVAGVRQLGRPVRTALLGERGVPPRDVVLGALLGGHDEVHPHVAPLGADRAAVGLARAHGLAVVPWTVNLAQDAQLLAEAGCAAAITDEPERLRRSLEPALTAG